MKTALITGASSGIGKALAGLMASKGINLVISGRRLKNLEKEYQISLYCVAKDLAEVNAAESLYTDIKLLGVSIDYLVNNAGFGGHESF